MIQQLLENNEYCRHLGRNGEKARLVSNSSATAPLQEGDRGSIESPVKKYLPLSKACKEWLKSPGQAELAQRNSDHAHFPEQATYLTAATAFVDIYAYSNKIFCFEAQLVQHPLHKTSGFIHEYASFSWNTEMLNFIKQYYHLGLPLKCPPPTDCTDLWPNSM